MKKALNIDDNKWTKIRQHGYLYKIHNGNNNMVYVGSTVDLMIARLKKHVKDFVKFIDNNESNFMTSFYILAHNEHDSCVMEQIGEMYNYNLIDLHREESEYIMKTRNAVNMSLPDMSITHCLCGEEINRAAFHNHVSSEEHLKYLDSLEHKGYIKGNGKICISKFHKLLNTLDQNKKELYLIHNKDFFEELTKRNKANEGRIMKIIFNDIMNKIDAETKHQCNNPTC